jgi:hypothetical protein
MRFYDVILFGFLAALALSSTDDQFEALMKEADLMGLSVAIIKGD